MCHERWNLRHFWAVLSRVSKTVKCHKIKSDGKSLESLNGHAAYIQQCAVIYSFLSMRRPIEYIWKCNFAHASFSYNLTLLEPDLTVKVFSATLLWLHYNSFSCFENGIYLRFFGLWMYAYSGLLWSISQAPLIKHSRSRLARHHNGCIRAFFFPALPVMIFHALV